MDTTLIDRIDTLIVAMNTTTNACSTLTGALFLALGLAIAFTCGALVIYYTLRGN